VLLLTVAYGDMLTDRHAERARNMMSIIALDIYDIVGKLILGNEKARHFFPPPTNGYVHVIMNSEINYTTDCPICQIYFCAF
jgi:hypothetical protein